MEKLEREQVVEREIPPGEQRTATIQTETRLGINADPTGYGKTLSMIGLLVRDKMLIWIWWFAFEAICGRCVIQMTCLFLDIFTRLSATVSAVVPEIPIHIYHISKWMNML